MSSKSPFKPASEINKGRVHLTEFGILEVLRMVYDDRKHPKEVAVWFGISTSEVRRILETYQRKRINPQDAIWWVRQPDEFEAELGESEE